MGWITAEFGVIPNLGQTRIEDIRQAFEFKIDDIKKLLNILIESAKKYTFGYDLSPDLWNQHHWWLLMNR